MTIALIPIGRTLLRALTTQPGPVDLVWVDILEPRRSSNPRRPKSSTKFDPILFGDSTRHQFQLLGDFSRKATYINKDRYVLQDASHQVCFTTRSSY